MKNKLITGLVALGLPALAFAWGQKGHDTTAYIAECHLTPTAKAAIDSLLDGRSIVYWSNWMDNASHTPEYAYSRTWHYKNVDAGVKYEKAKKNKDGDVVRAINDQSLVLMDDNATRQDKALALKMVVHFLGDIHQPLHLGHLSDLGGNRIHVQYFTGNRNLHSMWDTTLPEGAHKWSYTEWQNQIDRASADEEMLILANGTPDDWAKESMEIAAKIYEVTPEGYNISYDYIADWTPTIEQQFLKGGLRLADLLNTIFDPEYQPKNAMNLRQLQPAE